MNLIRPLAGAVLLTLLFTAAPFAESVEVITPGGGVSISPPSISGSDSGAAGTAPRTDNVASASASTGDGSSSSSSDPYVQPGLQTRHFGAQASLTCKVASSSHDLVVINNSPEPLPPGTRIKWQLTQENKRGYFAITGELGGGKTLVADGVLDGKATQGEACVARVI
jgi:hypothetical protein